MNQLESLKKHTCVVIDTADFSLLKEFSAEDATTNPSLVLAGSQVPQHAHLVNSAVEFARSNVSRLRDGLLSSADDERAQLLELAVDKLTVSFGVEILKAIPGRVSSEVDARLSYDADKMVKKAQHIVQLYAEAGVPKERLYIKLASTWEGIRAAERLEREGINCNLTLLFSFDQAVACAQAGVALISPFVGRVLDWYKAKYPEQADTFIGAQDPGVIAVTKIYNYYKRHGYKTVVMGASFRNTGEVLELAGCDKLTISPKLLQELASTPGEVVRKLDPARLTQSIPKLSELTRPESLFERETNNMAVEKLEEGIRNFAKDTEKLEALIATLL
ncbi:transaldolase, putative [Trypanosoma equiperdum]|uniref:Transaldolase n=2 Tax=Trypanozoon TaxID=39700 RepID=Q57X22_TRYB2|nr:transaldolase, putative [Trypanosoma brucei brucei TREU927]AAX69845.1 transaldolase, putative [Trypanosoma brucei]AAZ13324.1 transaldolase, putative [Trypanosoma brucei brucei TREU927]SCU67197.1 transaldolase, putative [Trypanosoma equiperdum]